MQKTSLFCAKLILSFLCVLSISGCGDSRDKGVDAKSATTQVVAKQRNITAETEQRSAVNEQKTQDHPPAQMLTPAKQDESIPPTRELLTPPGASANLPPQSVSPAMPVKVEPADIFGNQSTPPDNAMVNPLREMEDQPISTQSTEPAATPVVKIASLAVPQPAVQTVVESAQKIETTKPTVQHPKNKIRDEPFDPIKENGAIFVDWPKPKAALLITGLIEGYIEPCGCAGLELMKGGIGRRHTLFKMLEKQGWPVAGLDVGGMAIGFGRQAEMKFQAIAEGMRRMGYEAIGLGTTDLRLPTGELAAVTANVNGQPSPFISANVGLFGFDSGMTSTYRIIKVGEKRIGVTAILGKSYRKEVQNDDIEIIAPDAAIKKIMPKLKGQTDYMVLLAYAAKDETIALAKQFPEFNLVVTSDGSPEPPKEAQPIAGTKTLLIEVGHKGMNAIVIGLYDEPQLHVRYQRVPLDSRFEASHDMKMLMVAYQDQIKALGFAGLGVRPVPQPQKQSNGNFTASNKCETCHEESYKIWKKSFHSKAYDTLVKLDPPRNFDPECVSCHVVGWNPTRFFPYEGGFESQEKTPKLTDVGCDSCHGPGEKHIAAESGSNEALMEKYRKAVRLTKADAEKFFCVSCHDGDNSPQFQFKTYWPLVEHYETSKPNGNGQ